MTGYPIRACVFDAYGTLFDVHSAVARNAEVVGNNSVEVSKLWRTEQLEYSWVHTLMGRHVDFWELTGAALEYALAFYDVRNERVKRTLLESYLSLDAHPEVPAALQRLRAVGLKTAVLSNGSPFMLDRAIRLAGLFSLLDECLLDRRGAQIQAEIPLLIGLQPRRSLCSPVRSRFFRRTHGMPQERILSASGPSG